MNEYQEYMEDAHNPKESRDQFISNYADYAVLSYVNSAQIQADMKKALAEDGCEASDQEIRDGLQGLQHFIVKMVEYQEL